MATLRMTLLLMIYISNFTSTPPMVMNTSVNRKKILNQVIFDNFITFDKIKSIRKLSVIPSEAIAESRNRSQLIGQFRLYGEIFY